MAHSTSLTALSHPDYHNDSNRWQEYRLTYEGGEDFMRKYLLRPADETEAENRERKLNTPIPAVAADAIDDVRRSISQRLTDVTRTGGSPYYQAAVAGEGSGIDREGSSMNTFIAQPVLTDLLVMGRVGIYVDNIAPGGPTLADGAAKPYAYAYRVEDIINWTTMRPEEEGTFSMILLRDHEITFNHAFGINFPSKSRERFRLIQIGPNGFVRYRFFKSNTGMLEPIHTEVTSSQLRLDDEGWINTRLREIPFIMPALNGSMLKNVASYQRMLMNVSSNEAMFAININSPMLTIMKDARADGAAWKKPPGGEAEPGGQRGRNNSVQQGIRSGWVRGRFYGLGEDRPGWISAPVESLKASSEYQKVKADEIRSLVNVAVQNQTGTRTESRETRELSAQGLESGLQFIASKLQHVEQQVAKFVAMYEGNPKEVAKVVYPRRYNLKSDSERIKDANDLTDVTDKLPGQAVKKESAKQVISTLFTGRVPSATMTKMIEEIDKHAYINSFDNVMLLRENALISDDLAAASQDLPKSEVKQGKKDRAEQIKITMEAQTSPGEESSDSPDRPAARGAKELDPNKKSGSDERAEDVKKRGAQKAKKVDE